MDIYTLRGNLFIVGNIFFHIYYIFHVQQILIIVMEIYTLKFLWGKRYLPVNFFYFQRLGGRKPTRKVGVKNKLTAIGLNGLSAFKDRNISSSGETTHTFQ